MAVIRIDSMPQQIILDGSSVLGVRASVTSGAVTNGYFRVKMAVEGTTWTCPDTFSPNGSIAFVPDTELIYAIQGRKNAAGRVVVEYMSGSNVIASAEKSIDCVIAESIAAPALGAGWVTIAPANGSTAYPADVYVMNSRLTAVFDLSKIEFKYGAGAVDIASGRWYLNVAGNEAVTDGMINRGDSLTVTIPRSGPVKVVCTVTDTRGFTASETFTIEAYEYTKPNLSAITIFRADASGNADENGAFMYVSAVADYADLGGKNAILDFMAGFSVNGSATVVYTDMESGVPVMLGAGSVVPTRSYRVTITLSDICGSTTVYETVIATASAAFNIMPGGKGAAFSRLAEREKAIDLADWDLVTGGDIEAGGATFTKDIHAPNLKFFSALDAYPVGSIYLAVDNVSPAVKFGGTWAKIEDCFLMAAGTKYQAGSTGGEADHTLTIEEMPAHSHYAGNNAEGSEEAAAARFNTAPGLASSNIARKEVGEDSSSSIWVLAQTNGYGQLTQTLKTADTGGGQAFSILPPYMAVHVWYRTA